MAPIVVNDASVAADVRDAGVRDAAQDVEADVGAVGPPGPRLGIAGSTLGKIACGGAWCTAGSEICAAMEPGPAWTCLPVAKESSADGQRYECDDTSDCARGRICCDDSGSGSDQWSCTTRDGCRMEVCEENGAACPVGMSCRQRMCRPVNVPGPKCGSSSCTGGTPICLWRQGKGTCVSEERGQELVQQRVEEGVQSNVGAILACTRNSDCGTQFHCCTGGMLGESSSFCSLNCDLMGTQQYCDSDKDCPTLSQVGGGKLVFRCKPGSGLVPPWSRRCQI